MRILICTPNTFLEGGVSNYYRVMSKFYFDFSDYFFVGTTKINESLLKKIFLRFKNYITFYKNLKTKKFDAVIVNPSFNLKAILRDSIFVLLSNLLNIKVIVFFRGWKEDFEDNSFKYVKFYYRLVFNRINAMIVLSEKIKNKVKDYGFSGKVFIETTVYDESLISSLDKNYWSHKKKKNEAFTILFLARLEKYKGIYEAINAFEIISKKHPDLSLIIAGDGTEYVSAREYVKNKKLKNIFFTGYVRNLKKIDILKKADIYLLPSYSEGLPSSLLEAMAFGLPSLVTPVGGIPDMYKEGEMGYLIHKNEPKEISFLIEKLICNSYQRNSMIEYNYNYAKSTFSSEVVAKRFKKIIKQVIQNS